MHNPYTTAYKYGFSIFNKTIKKQMPIAQWSHFTFSYIYSSPNGHGAMNQLEITEKERKGIVNRYRGLLRSAKSNLSPEEVKVIRRYFLWFQNSTRISVRVRENHTFTTLLMLPEFVLMKLGLELQQLYAHCFTKPLSWAFKCN